MAPSPPIAPDDPDQAWSFRLRAGPQPFAQHLHDRVRRAVDDALEEGLDVRGAPRGWAVVGPLSANGRRPPEAKP